MTITDRMSNLDSRREITDRTGQTVILGNSVGSAALSSIAQIVSAAAGESRATADMLMPAAASLDFQNASFGIWSVFLDIDTTASLAAAGAAIGASRFNDIAAGLLTWGADAMLLNIRAFTSTQAYTPTAGTAKVVVVCVGGGGGGGGCSAVNASNSAGGGGGAGSVAMGVITSGFSGVTITIGAGGTGGAVGANQGATGGTTSFGSVLSAGGGVGGSGDTAGGIARATSGGAGGSASGSASLYGQRGQSGGHGVAETVVLSQGGTGGASPYGSGGTPAVAGSPSTAPGNGANGFGGGGGGAAAAAASTSAAGNTGGAGSAGLCIVYEYNA